ncbi:MAG TPA: hypothetical protein VL687_04670 [Methylomirabilota bacterium]|jgi:hypothetical protein|nr:hypothetical protein [Methylomirabilota bacterium]
MRTNIGATAATAGSFTRRRTSALAEAVLVYLLVAILAGFTGLTAFTLAAPANWAGLASLEGVMSVGHGDDFAHGREAGHTYFLTSAKGETELAFDGDPPGDSLSGARIRVHGVGEGSRFLVAAGGTQKISSPPSTASGASGAKRVAVVLINFANDASEPYTPSFARGVAFTNTDSVAAYYAETSSGLLTFSGDVFGWYTIPESDSNCATATWATSATTAASSAGVDLSAYDNVVYAFPTAPECYWAGMAQLPGRSSWLNGPGAMSLHVMAHELGHNFGTHHGSALNCMEAGVRVSLSADPTNCTANEYGDPFTVMGQALQYQHSNYAQANFGWLQAANSLAITTAGDYTLLPVESVDGIGVQALQVARTSNTFFTLEYRQPVGAFDTFPATMPVATGVSIRVTYGYGISLQSQLVDTVPSTTSFMDAPLLVGNTLVDPLSGISITTVAVSPAGATVRIAFGSGGSPTPTAMPSPSAVPSPTPGASPSPPADLQPPTVPTDLRASQAKGKKLTLTWSPSSDNVAVAGYRVYRDGTLVGTASTTTFGVVLGRRSATFWVLAYDEAGNLSGASAPISLSP